MNRDDGTVEKLSSDDTVRCLNGKEELVKKNVLLMQSLHSYRPNKERHKKSECSRLAMATIVHHSAFCSDIMGYDFSA